MPQLPTELLNQIGVALETVVAVLTAFLVALWVSLALWTLKDIRARSRDIFAWILATVLVLAGGPIGLLFYTLLRPRETLAEAFDRQLEEEALLRDVSARRACPTCQTVTEPDWLVCPRCRTELRRTCESCGRALELDWVACPYCTAPVAGNIAASGQPLLQQPAQWTAVESADDEAETTVAA
jgi:RNA polymerase subunit RPABC4/transcription elongation factor Spt4